MRGLPTLVAFRRARAQSATIRGITERYREATLRTLRIAFVTSGGAIVQPTRHPVTAYVLDSALKVTVRSSSPGTVAGGSCPASAR